MTWFHSKGGEQLTRPQDHLVSSEEIQSAFTEQRDYLYWVALLITGDKTAPEQAVVDRSKLSGFRGGVFRDWLIVWANHATMRTAVAGAFSEYSDYAVLSDDAIRSLREYNTTRLRIAHPCWTCPAELWLERTARRSDGYQALAEATCTDETGRILASKHAGGKAHH
jgi:hypothetical protein